MRGGCSVSGTATTAATKSRPGTNIGSSAVYAPPTVPRKRKRSPRQLVLARRNCIDDLSSAGQMPATMTKATKPASGENCPATEYSTSSSATSR